MACLPSCPPLLSLSSIWQGANEPTALLGLVQGDRSGMRITRVSQLGGMRVGRGRFALWLLADAVC